MRNWAIFSVMFLFCFFGFTHSALAVTSTYIGGTTGNWQTSASWDNGIPDATTNVVISSSSNITVTATGTINFSTLQVGGGSATTQNLILTGNIETGGSITIANKGTLTQNNIIAQTISGTLLVQSGGTLTHTTNSSAQSYGVNFSANSITVNGTVFADGLGYAGVPFGSGQGPGAGVVGPGLEGSGAGYGGDGGRGADNSVRGGYNYCDFSNLNSIGIGSSGGARHDNPAPGNSGGGLIILNATGTINLSGGTITADGGANPSVFWNGGGSGGGIKIIADTVTGTPAGFTATGGYDYGFGAGGGAGGGCVYIGYTTANSIVPTASYYSAAGGYNVNPGNGYYPEGGGAGQTLIQKTGASGDLYLKNLSTNFTITTATSSLTLDSIYLGTNAIYSIPASKTITLNSSTPFQGDSTGELRLYGTLTSSTPFNIITASIVSVYSGGSFNNDPATLNIGSSGGLRLYAGASVTNKNLTNLNSTGTLYIASGIFSTITNLKTAGATSLYSGFATSSVTNFTISGNTTALYNYTTSTPLTLNSLTINSGGTLTHGANAAPPQTSVLNISANNITVNTGGSITANSVGYTSAGNNTAGRGAGGGGYATNQDGAGAGYGGVGGNSAHATGGSVYCNINDPALSGVGSSGGSANGYYGGTGGGLIDLNVSSTLTVSGAISANGGNGVGYWDGGGSGGAIKIIAGTIAGTPSSFTAIGGSPGNGGGGGGGGGGCVNITYTYTNSITSASINVSGGSGYQAGSAGQKQLTQKIYGLVGWWTFDGPDVTTSTVNDKSGQANNGTRYGGISMIMGKVGQAANFNGTSNYIRSPYNNFPSADSDRSISFWVRSTNMAVTSTALVGWGTNSANAASVLELGPGGVANSEIAFYTNGSTFSSEGTLANNVWNYVTFVLSGTTGSLYINGVLDNSGPVSGVNTTAASNFYMGAFTGLNSFKGNLDEVRVYSRALSAQEIIALYNLNVNKINSSAITKGGTLASSGLVGLWTFDGKDVNTSTVFDKSGLGNNGTRQGTTKVTLGKIGQAINFDGSTGYINIPDSPSLSFGNGSGSSGGGTDKPFSITMWAKPAVPLNIKVAAAIAKETTVDIYGSGANREWLGVSYLDGKIYWYLYQGNSANRIGVFGPNTALTVGKWHQVVYTYNGSETSAGMAIYIDAVKINNNTDPLGNYTGMPDNTAPITVGLTDLQADHSNGPVDEVRIYSRALSFSEIQQLYKKGGGKISSSQTSAVKSSANSGLLGWWTFDGMDINSSTVLDKSGYNNNGARQGTTKAALGKIGQGMKFDGTSAHIYIGDGSGLSLNTQYTVSAWVNTSDLSRDTAILSLRNNAGLGIRFQLDIESGNTFNFAVRDNAAHLAVATRSMTIKTNKWYHVVGVRDGNNVYTYVDAVAGTAGNASLGVLTVNKGEIGALWTADGLLQTSTLFKGIIDDVRIYSRALSAKEVQTLYKSGSGMKIK